MENTGYVLCQDNSGNEETLTVNKAYKYQEIDEASDTICLKDNTGEFNWYCLSGFQKYEGGQLMDGVRTLAKEGWWMEDSGGGCLLAHKDFLMKYGKLAVVSLYEEGASIQKFRDEGFPLTLERYKGINNSPECVDLVDDDKIEWINVYQWAYPLGEYIPNDEGRELFGKEADKEIYTALLKWTTEDLSNNPVPELKEAHTIWYHDRENDDGTILERNFESYDLVQEYLQVWGEAMEIVEICARWVPIDTDVTIKPASEDPELAEIKDYIKHLHNSIEGDNGMLDEMARVNWDYDEKYDVTISFNGKSITLGMRANLYDNLTKLLKQERDEF